MKVESSNSERNILRTQVTNNLKKYNETQQNKTAQSNNQTRTDKLELSQEAKNLNAIQAKVKSGFYNKQEILKETAARISQDIPTNK